jgi:hypothetical protein
MLVIVKPAIIGVLTALAAGGAVTAHAAAGSGTPARAPSPAVAAARADAARTLALTRLPPGARRVDAAPDRELQAPAMGPPATPRAVDRHRWWVVPGRPRKVLSHVAGHLPDDARRVASGTGVDDGHRVWSAAYALPDAPGLDERMLVVAVTSVGSARTGVRADGQAVWTSPPVAHRVPAATRRIDVSVLRGPSGGRTVTLARRHAVRRVVAAVDALRRFPPGAMSCPDDRGALLRLTFRTAGGRRLARASVDPSGCDVVVWRPRGKRAHGLAGATRVVRAVRPLLPFTIER